MTGLIVLALIGYFAFKAYSHSKAVRTEANRKKQIDHLYRENQRRMQEHKSLLCEQERERKEREREEEKLWKEQLRLRREQERQAEQLAKHDKRIADLEYRMNQAEEDITHWKETVCSLYALLDIEENNYSSTAKGSKESVKIQKRIITLTNQIHNAEARINKAQHIKEQAQRELAA